jgi:signal transduction histidine kinase
VITEAALPDSTHAARVRQGEQDFIYSVAHDLRAPLRGLNGYSTALLEEYGSVLGEQGRGYAERIAAASEQMAQLIEDLLELSRLSQAEVRLQPVDLGAEAARIAEEIQLREPSRQGRFAIQRPVPAVADRKLIRMALHHLLDNAWKFTSGQDQTLIEFGTAASGNAAICCYVRDNGAGFDPAHAGKLFQPFGRLHSVREYPGSGVGLAGVRQIVEAHGGRVWAAGAIGEGATFYFTLGGEESR